MLLCRSSYRRISAHVRLLVLLVVGSFLCTGSASAQLSGGCSGINGYSGLPLAPTFGFFAPFNQGEVIKLLAPGAGYSIRDVLTNVTAGPSTGAQTVSYTIPSTAARTIQIIQPSSGPVTMSCGVPTFTVTVNSDTTAGTAANCVDGSTTNPSCSLRDALAAAAATASGTVRFSSTAFTASTTITLVQGMLSVPSNVTIQGLTTGSGASLKNLITVNGNNATVFNVASGVTGAKIANLTIRGGYSDTGGGGVNIASGASVSIDACSITGNQAGAPGAGIANRGTLSLTNSLVANNQAAGNGAGLYNTGVATIAMDTFTGNTTTGGLGGAISSGGTLTASHVTITSNSSAYAGGGVIITGGTASFSGSIIGNNADNADGLLDISYQGSAPTLTNSLTGYVQGSGTALDPKLAPLGYYGGPTQTMPVLPSSPAFCAGTPATGVDQRGAPLSTTYGSTACTDIGATNSNYGLAFTTQPASTYSSGVNFGSTTAPVVSLTDFGTPLPASSGTIALTDSASALQGTTNISLSNATTSASFAAVKVSSAQTSDKLTARYTSGVTPAGSFTLTSAQSDPFDVTIPLHHFTITGVPASATAGVSFNVTVTAYADSGTTVSSTYQGPITLTSTDTSAVFPSSVTWSNGVATIAVTLKTAGSQTLTATDGTNTSVTKTSSAINVSAAAASQIFAANGSGQSTIITNAFSNPLVVQTLDAYLNPVGGVTVNLVIPTSGASLQGGTYQCTTNTSATPTGSCSINITANGTTGSYSVSAQASSLTSASFSLTNLAKTTQTITFTNPGAQTFGTSPTLTASSTSLLAVTFTSTTTDVCTVTSAGTLTFLKGGPCTIQADQAGNSTYAAATPVSRSFTVNAVAPGAPVIGLATAGNQQATIAFTAPASNGGSEITSYTVISSPDNLSGSGTGSPITVTGLTNGRAYSFTVKAENNVGFGSLSSASNSATPTGPQTITFSNPGPQTFGTTPTLTATSTSSLSVTFTSSTPSVCTVTSGGVLTFVAAGPCIIHADQPGNTAYDPAQTVTQSFTVEPASQTISFTQPASPVTFGLAPITLSATGGASGNAVTFSVLSGPGTVSANTLTVSGAGTIVVAANQPGNGNYNAASEVTRNVVVNAAAATVVWSTPAAITYGQALSGTQLNASATGVGGAALSGSFTYTPAAGTYLPAGAAQTLSVSFAPENASYATTPQTTTITVNKASTTLTGPGSQPVFVLFSQTGAVPLRTAGQFSGAGITAPSGAVTYTIKNASNTTVATGPLAIADGVVNVPVASSLAPGLYTVAATYDGDANYSASTPVAVQVQVGQIDPVISWSTPSALTYGTTLAGVLNAQAKDGSNVVAGSYAYLNGGSSVTSTTVLPAGNYTLTVNFTPVDTTTYKPVTATVALTVNKASPALSLRSSVSTVLTTNPVTFTATAASTVSTPTGTVTFLDGSTQIGTASLVNGVASLTTSTLALGTHSITAAYAGDNNFTAVATAGPTALVVSDFNLVISATSGSGTSTTQSVLPGGQAVYKFTLSPVGSSTFPTAVTLSVSGLPTGASYTISPTTIAAGSGATNVTLTINIPKDVAMLKTASPILAALLLLPFSGAIRRRAKKLGQLAAVLMLLGVMGALTGCGAGTGFFGQQPQTYNVTISGTSGNLTRSTAVTLTVQ